jgi:hypothetical protein
VTNGERSTFAGLAASPIFEGTMKNGIPNSPAGKVLPLDDFPDGDLAAAMFAQHWLRWRRGRTSLVLIRTGSKIARGLAVLRAAGLVSFGSVPVGSGFLFVHGRMG